jgi:hypothetical protein
MLSLYNEMIHACIFIRTVNPIKGLFESFQPAPEAQSSYKQYHRGYFKPAVSFYSLKHACKACCYKHSNNKS